MNFFMTMIFAAKKGSSAAELRGSLPGQGPFVKPPKARAEPGRGVLRPARPAVPAAWGRSLMGFDEQNQ
jgi:hypothetical protein